ncbi:sensor histidine kinase [Trinickia fusca]|uniref:histidine kinase n=1 Tax=Trinickia fusca TaxID=2419777 RepID=A0A494X2P7_9BURK|nr:PAS domain S-box protein [Trinickia fusca]RKP43891.1 PAS domain S-box protein [Trinickia fusca]
MASAVKRFGATTSRWIMVGLLAGGVLILATVAIGALGTIRLYESEAEVERANEVHLGLERLLELARDAETGQRGYVITGRVEYLEPYLKALPQLRQQFDSLATLLQDPVQKQRLTQLHGLLDRKQVELASVIAVRQTQGFEAAQAIVQNDTGRQFMDRARAIVEDMEATVREQTTLRQAHASNTRDTAITMGFASGALTLLVCLSFVYLASRLLRLEGVAVAELAEQKEMLDVTLSGIGDGVIAVDVDGRVTFFNRVAEALTGWRQAAVIGQHIESVLTFRRGPDKEVVENPALVAMRERRRVAGPPGEPLLIARDDGEAHIDASSAPTFDVAGTLLGAVIVLHDVLERERAEERFRLAVEASPNAMVMVDARGTIELINSQTERLFGYKRDELLGQPVEMLVPLRFRAKHVAHRDAFLHAPAARPMGVGRDLFGIRRDGTEFPIEIGLNPIETAEGVFVLSAIADVTERKRAELELRQRSEELARSNQDLEQFAYVASHDLQEPLRAVAGPLQLLQRRYQGQLDARADEFIGHAVDGATRMQALIDDLLSYSRVGRLEDPQQNIDSGEVLTLALRNLTAVIDESHAHITHDAMPIVRAIPTQLTLLFQNLLGNAIKFRSQDRPLRVHVGVTALADEWQFSIKDSGIGIDAQYFDRIFLIFQRLHTRREYPGTGLGLALCKRIVEHHGGRIWVESTPNEGTTFFFTLRDSAT